MFIPVGWTQLSVVVVVVIVIVVVVVVGRTRSVIESYRCVRALAKQLESTFEAGLQARGNRKRSLYIVLLGGSTNACV